MNATYSESYKLPAGVLAVVVHGAFFALLYFGFTWQTQPPAAMSVTLWQSLPDEQVAAVQAQPVVQPAPVVQPTPEVKPVQAEVKIKPDIVMPTKKPIPKPVEVKPVHPAEPKKAEVKKPAKPAGPSPAEQQAAREQAAQSAQAAQAAQTAQAAAGRVVDEYMAKISGKIKRNIVMPPDVPNDALAVFSVTLLPGGSVLEQQLKLLQSSGNAAYDNAVERAILKSQPLPLPADPNMFNRFRELKLKFKPVE